MTEYISSSPVEATYLVEQQTEGSPPPGKFSISYIANGEIRVIRELILWIRFYYYSVVFVVLFCFLVFFNRNETAV